MDALVYAEIPNNISDTNELADLANSVQIAASSTSEINNSLTNYLNETTVKRACCLGRAGPPKADNSTGVKVRIPIPTGYNVKGDVQGEMENKFGYIDKMVYVPENMCNSQLTPGSGYCDNFYEIYCSNIRQLYQTENDGNFNEIEFSKYKPECACYSKPKEGYNSIPPKCYMMNCNQGVSGMYLDPLSRTSGPCNMTICNAIFQASGLSAGGSMNVNNQVQQNCGQYMPKQGGSTTTKTGGSTSAPVNINSETASGTGGTSGGSTTVSGAGAEGAKIIPNSASPTASSTSSESQPSFLKRNLWLIIGAMVFIFILIMGIVIYKKRSGNKQLSNQTSDLTSNIDSE